METVAAVAQTLETWRHTDVVLQADGEPTRTSMVRAIANVRVHRTLPRHGPPSSSKPGTGRSVHSGLPWNLCGEQVGSGGRIRLSSSAETSRDRVVDQTRCLAHDQVQHWTRRVLSLQEDLWQAIRLQSGRPSSRVEPRWELGAWVGKMELTDEHLLGTFAGIRSSRTIYRLPEVHCFNKDALDRIVGTPTNPKPDGAARDPQVRRHFVTQRWVDEHAVKAEVRCPTLKRAERYLKQSRRGSTTNRWKRQRGCRTAT